MNPNENFTTQDYGLANWLAFNRTELLGAIEFPGETRKSFVFLNSPGIPSLVKEWEDPRSTDGVTCKRFFQAHSLIKKALKDSLDVSRLSDNK